MTWRSLIQGSPEYVLGLDEVGYGALAGPMVVSVVAAPLDWTLEGLKDSKALSAKKRIELDPFIHDFVVLEGWIFPAEIDAKGGHKALIALQTEVVRAASLVFPGCPVIVDGNLNIPGAISLVKADSKVPAVMAASVHAKVFRDNYMTEVLHKKYPQYDFENNKGYGTKSHYEGLRKHGPSVVHRKSYL